MRSIQWTDLKAGESEVGVSAFLQKLSAFLVVVPGKRKSQSVCLSQKSILLSWIVKKGTVRLCLYYVGNSSRPHAFAIV